MAVILVLFGVGFCFSATPRRLLVRVPVADIRSEPRNYVLTGAQDPKEETQVLYGEMLWADREQGDWWHVEVPWQPSFRGSWQGYPGWIKKKLTVSAPQGWPEPTVVIVSKYTSLGFSEPHQRSKKMILSLGTRLVGTSPLDGWMGILCVDGSVGRIKASDVRRLDAITDLSDQRRCVVSQASRFLGDPYLWGGLSAVLPSPSRTKTGVDCSGLVHLSFRSCGVLIPRDAKDQWMKAEPVSTRELVPGDLIFLADAKRPDIARHVSIYAGNGNLIEAPSTGLVVRRISLKEKQKNSGRVITFGRVLGRAVK